MDIDNKAEFRLLTKRELREVAYPCSDRRKYILRGIYVFVLSVGILISAKGIHGEKFSWHLAGLVLLEVLIIPMFIWLLINTVNLYMDYKFLRYIMYCMKSGQEFRLWDIIENRGSRIHWRILRVPSVYFMLAKLLIDTENQLYVEIGERMRNLAIEADNRLIVVSNPNDAALLADKLVTETTFLRPVYLMHSLTIKFPIIPKIVFASVSIILLLYWIIGLVKALSQLLK